MPRRARGKGETNLFRSFLIAALVAGAWLTAPRIGLADASGCSFVPGALPADDAQCEEGGDGCYLCEYHNTGQPGYTECSENPNGSITYCHDKVVEYHQYGGSAAPRSGAGSSHAGVSTGAKKAALTAVEPKKGKP